MRSLGKKCTRCRFIGENSISRNFWMQKKKEKQEMDKANRSSGNKPPNVRVRK